MDKENKEVEKNGEDKKRLFAISGNICGERIRLGRVVRRLTQEELACKMNEQGYINITPLIISRIEQRTRHVIDAELKAFADVLNVSMEWLCGEGRDLDM